MARINDDFLTPSRTISAVHAVGSSIAGGEERVPLLVLDQSFAPFTYRPLRPLRVVEDFLDSLLWRILRAAGDDRHSHDLKRYPLASVGNDIKSLLKLWELPENTMIAFSDPPRSAFDANGRVWAGQKNATLGIFLLYADRMVATTAGHLVETIPCAIVRRHFGFFNETIERIGTVELSNDPRTVAGVDVALINLAAVGPHDSGFTAASIAAAPDVRDLSTTTLRGGRSGLRRGWINGDAFISARALDGRIWTNCWNVVEIEDGYGRPGDSGGLVLADDGATLGHLVATLGTIRRGGRYQCGLVQDISTMLAYVRTMTGETSVPMIPQWEEENWFQQLWRRW